MCLVFSEYSPTAKRITVPLEIKLSLSYTQEDVECLTRVVYNEARGETAIGQVAVAMVVINRTKSSRFTTNSICSTSKAPKQFAYRLPSYIELGAYKKARQLATYTLAHYYTLPPDMRGWMFFNSHAPRAAGTTIGGHTFYERFTR